MSKLVITSALNGTIRFVEGEEMEISLDQLKDKISGLEQRKLEISSNLTTKLDELKVQEKIKLDQAKESFDQEVKIAEDKYNSLVTEIQDDTNQRLELQLKANGESEKEVTFIEKELLKLNTILKSVIPPEINSPLEEKIEEPASREEIHSQPEVVQNNRLIF